MSDENRCIRLKSVYILYITKTYILQSNMLILITN